MVQTLKEEVRQRITKAALDVFAACGYGPTKVSEIAERAGVATGNVYRYFDDKDALFREIVDDDFVEEFQSLLSERVRSFPKHPGASSTAFTKAAEELLSFCIQNRLRMIILLGGGADGSRHAAVREKTVDDLITLALEHFGDPGAPPVRFALREIYRNLVRTMVAALEHYERDASIRAAVEAYTRYHLAGLKALLAR
jgi:AcrR family transcriptional regulator